MWDLEAVFGGGAAIVISMLLVAIKHLNERAKLAEARAKEADDDRRRADDHLNETLSMLQRHHAINEVQTRTISDLVIAIAQVWRSA